jgi:hypothetical protein
LSTELFCFYITSIYLIIWSEIKGIKGIEMRKIILSIFILIVSFNALACMNDFECGNGNKCVKPEDSININGTCVTPTDEFGNRDYSAEASPPNIEPHEVQGCMFDSDCDIGFSCMKKSEEIKGVCIK